MVNSQQLLNELKALNIFSELQLEEIQEVVDKVKLNQQRTGKWLHTDEGVVCSNCHTKAFELFNTQITTTYCPECGSKLKGW